jgi:transcriptional regulator with XRE-family HTH domain
MLKDRYSNARLAMLIETGLNQKELAARLSVLQWAKDEPRVGPAQVSRWMHGKTIMSRFWDSIETLHSEAMANKAIKLQK